MKRKAISATLASALLCGALVYSPSCAAPPLTEIIVSVNSTFAPGELDMVRLLIDRDGDSRVIPVDLADIESLPFTQGVVHRGGALGVSISVEGSRGGEVLLVQLADIHQFIEGETLEVSVELAPSCVDVMCSEGSTCRAGSCVSLGGADAGAPDTGTADGGLFDGGLLDGEPLVDAMADGTLMVDAGPGECPDERTNIEGDYVCEAGCDDCHLRCKTADCRVTCRSGASCRADAEDVNIIAECEAGSTCSISTKNNEAGRLSARCVESDCEVDCEGDDPCDVQCEDAECLLDCHDNDDCVLRGCTPEDCGSDVFVCGRDCP